MNNKPTVLITGSRGFLGKHLTILLKKRHYNVLSYDVDNSEEDLEASIKQSDWIVHLAGAMRPKETNDFYVTNCDLTQHVVDIIKKTNSKASVIFTSSIQSKLNNDYGISKLTAEKILYKLESENGNKVIIFRLTNVFGKWGRPNYNSVVANFCFNIARNLPIAINNKDSIVNFVYVDDVIQAFLDVIEKKNDSRCPEVKPIYPVTVGALATKIIHFKKCLDRGLIPMLSSEFDKKLYNTFLSFIPNELFLKKEAFDNGTISFENPLHEVSVVKLLPNKEYGGYYFNSTSLNVYCVSESIKITIRVPFEDSAVAITLATNDSFIIPEGFWFKMSNESKEKTAILTLIKTRNGSRDDIYKNSF